MDLLIPLTSKSYGIVSAQTGVEKGFIITKINGKALGSEEEMKAASLAL